MSSLFSDYFRFDQGRSVTRISLRMRRELDEAMEFVQAVRNAARCAGSVSESEIKQEALERWGLCDVRLRPYQVEGVRWLAQRCARRHGCILADEMGLGKTLQVSDVSTYAMRW